MDVVGILSKLHKTKGNTSKELDDDDDDDDDDDALPLLPLVQHLETSRM